MNTYCTGSTITVTTDNPSVFTAVHSQADGFSITLKDSVKGQEGSYRATLKIVGGNSFTLTQVIALTVAKSPCEDAIFTISSAAIQATPSYEATVNGSAVLLNVAPSSVVVSNDAAGMDCGSESTVWQLADS